MTASAWSGARRILCIRLDQLGDLLMTAPALRALRSLEPTPELTLLASPAGAAVAELLPEADAVIPYAAPWMKASGPPSPSADRALVARLAGLRFDAAVIFTVYSQSPLPAALLCHLAGVPRRLAHCRENPYHLLTDWVREPEPERFVRHEVRRQLDLVASIGARAADERLAVRLGPGAAWRARGRLAAAGWSPARPWVVVHPGASAPSRQYPAEGFAAVARELAGDGWQILFLGSGAERELVAGIQREAGVPTLSLAGATSLEELAAVLSLAPVALCNNSGPAHLAAAVGTPVVDLYALTNPQHGPWGVPHRVLFHDVACRWCYRSECPEGHHGCLRGIPPSRIAEAVRELAREGRWAERPAAVLLGAVPAGVAPIAEAPAQLTRCRAS